MFPRSGSMLWLKFLIIFITVFLTGCNGIRYSLYEKAMHHERKKAGAETMAVMESMGQ